MEVARGNVGDRPFARTIYTIAAKRFTGDLILTSGSSSYKVSWEGGQLSAAESPHAADQPTKVGLKAHLVDTTAVSDAMRQVASNPKLDLLEVLARVGGLRPEQVLQLKRQTFAARALRIFALPQATFVLNNARSLRADPAVPALDARWLIHHGVRSHYSTERLEAEAATVTGRKVRLAPDAASAIAVYGFAPEELAVIEKIRSAELSVDELVQACAPTGRHRVLGVLYSLVATDGLIAGAEVAPSAAPSTPPPEPPASATPAPGAGNGRATGSPMRPRQRSASVAVPARPAGRGSAARGKGTSGSERARRHSSFQVPVGQRGSKGKVTAQEVRNIIQQRLALLRTDASHFDLIGVPENAPKNALNDAYFTLARKLHPDRLQALGISDLHSEAQEVFARINQAFAVLSSPAKAKAYREELRARREQGVSEGDAEQLAARLFAAEDHFRKGEMALRRNHFALARDEFRQAAELNPDDPEHLALAAWSTWCASEDKDASAKAANKELAKAIALSSNCVPAWFYRGMIAQGRGQEDAAAECFAKVLTLAPDHHEAKQQMRLLQSRGGEKRGLFRRR